MTDYPTGHLKRHPDTGDVAMRTHFPETIPELARLAWVIVSAVSGARSGSTADVSDWPDLPVAEGS